MHTHTYITFRLRILLILKLYIFVSFYIWEMPIKSLLTLPLNKSKQMLNHTTKVGIAFKSVDRVSWYGLGWESFHVDDKYWQCSLVPFVQQGSAHRAETQQGSTCHHLLRLPDHILQLCPLCRSLSETKTGGPLRLPVFT